MAVALQTFRDTLAETQAELIQAGKLAALGQLAAGVAPWVPVAANQRDGQVAALYAGLARTGQAGPAAVATSRGETRRTEVSLKE